MNYKDKELFQVVIKDTIKIVEKQNLEYALKYNEVKSYKSIGNPWPHNAAVKLVQATNPFRYCVEHIYEVVADNELSEFDQTLLKAYGCFMVGQVYGVFSSPKVVDGKYIYSVRSFCDSGD